ncbi:ribokinase [Intrasporangium chromatireducens Q5-1]|uniref:Ribokinase n=1 Tax=Intrasporangium chromatireducens Q5-1 TaxID=584657 RepID=W9GLI8_9MICO|nr:ribokinase [Intrasporangium chromatireducens Q5-1]
MSVVGSLNVDLGYRVRTLPVPGETVLAGDRSRAFGGKGGNQAVTVAVLGADVGFVGAVGADDAGESYLSHLRRHGVDVSGVAVVPHVDTGTAIILVDDSGENLIVVDPGANSAVEPGWVEEHVRAAEPAVVLAQLEVPVPVLESMAASLAADVTFVLNPAPMQADPDDLAKLLQRVDVLVPNRKELGQLARTAEPETLAEVQRCLGALSFDGTVVVTLGADGAVVREVGGEPTHHPALSVDPVDTTGAGDAFCGALAVGIAAGRELSDAVRRAIEVAGRSTLHRGAQPTQAPLEADIAADGS